MLAHFALREIRLARGQEALHQAGNSPVKRLRVSISPGEHHGAFEGGNYVKGPRFRIGSADPLGQVVNASSEEERYFVGDLRWQTAGFNTEHTEEAH